MFLYRYKQCYVVPFFFLRQETQGLPGTEKTAKWNAPIVVDHNHGDCAVAGAAGGAQSTLYSAAAAVREVP